MFDTIPSLQCGRWTLKLDAPKIMAVVNATPDSFSDGGCPGSARQAIEFALQAVAQGADMLDIGGESTRPDAEPVSVDEELSRVIPVIEALAGQVDVPISIDTSKPEVMRAATGLHPDNARRQFAHVIHQQVSPNSPAHDNGAVLVEANKAADILAEVDSKNCNSHNPFLQLILQQL
jgi:hypothetical protein